MYNPLQSADSAPDSRMDQQPHYIPPVSGNNSSWSPIGADDYFDSEIGGVRNLAYNHTHSAPLTAQESYQRTYISESSLKNACQMSSNPESTPSSHTGQQDRAESYNQHDSRLHGYYRADHSIYSAAPPESAPYDTFSQSFHEYAMQSPSHSCRETSAASTAIENMVQVFPAHDSNVATHPFTSQSNHIVNSSTLTFQLGPSSMDQVDDPEKLFSSSLSDSMMDEDFAENEREESVGEPKMPGSPLQIYRDGTPSESESLTSTQTDGKRRSNRKAIHAESTKRSKMHQCQVCQKWFPRPSGLATHMNSHSGLRPFDCPLPTCNKSFAVRSNAKRHLRTHGIIPSPESPHKSIQYTVGFDTPLVTDVHETTERPATLRWVPQSLTSQTNVEWSKSIDSESEGEDGCPTLPVPLLPSMSPRSWDSISSHEEINSNEEGASHPYHPRHWQGLPGPAPE